MSASARRPAWPTFGRDVPDAAWRPSRDDLGDSRLARFVHAARMPDLETLQRRAEADPAWFWGAAADDLGIAWQRPPSAVLDATEGPEWTRWWIGGGFNYAEAATGPRARRDPDAPALAWEGEDGETLSFTASQLHEAVHRAARAFQALGVREGDRVGVLLPMLSETVITVLALGLLRAIYTPIFSGYGPAAVASRLADAGAKLLVTADGFLRRGEPVALKAVADEAVAGAPSVERVVVVRRLGEARLDTPWTNGRDVDWQWRSRRPTARRSTSRSRIPRRRTW